MQGQLSNEEFNAENPNRIVKNGVTIVKYGKHTYNYWTQHSDGSWTNYDCRTIY